MLDRFGASKLDHFADCRIDVQALVASRSFLDVIADPSDDGPCPAAVPDNAAKRLADLVQIRRLGAQPAQPRLGVGERSGDRLVDFMGDRGRELPHCCDTVGVRELRLRLAVALLALARLGLRPFALSQVDYESYTLMPGFEQRYADQHGHTATVLPEILLLHRLQPAVPPELYQPRCLSAIEPFRRREVPPVQASRGEIITVEAQQMKKGVIGFEDPTFELPSEDADDVGVDEAPDLGLTLAQDCLRLFALGQIEHESDDAIASEQGRAEQHRHPAAILAHILLFESFNR